MVLGEGLHVVDHLEVRQIVDGRAAGEELQAQLRILAQGGADAHKILCRQICGEADRFSSDCGRDLGNARRHLFAGQLDRHA
jgi:hypothetical protein